MVDYKELIEGYLLNNFIEQDRLEQILNHLREENEDKLIDRKNFIGHFTASAFVIAKKSKKILMLHHKVLRKYLQPGGHIEKQTLIHYRQLRENYLKKQELIRKPSFINVLNL